MKCLVTKLDGVVSDTSLKKLGELRLFVQSNGGERLILSKAANVEQLIIKSLDGTPCFSLTRGGELISELKLEGLLEKVQTLFLGEGEYELSILSKNGLERIFLPDSLPLASFNGNELYGLTNIKTLDFGLYESAKVDVSNMGKMPNLSSLTMTGQNISGNISGIGKVSENLTSLIMLKVNVVGDVASLESARLDKLQIKNSLGVVGDIMSVAAKNPLLKYLDVTACRNLTGDIASIKELSALTTLEFGDTSITGDLSNLGKMVNLSSVRPSNYVTGTIENMVAAFRANGKVLGEFTLKYVGALDGATFEGVSIRNWLASHGGKSSLKLTWTETTITGESV